jgi:hypothetical protein
MRAFHSLSDPLAYRWSLGDPGDINSEGKFVSFTYDLVVRSIEATYGFGAKDDGRLHLRNGGTANINGPPRSHTI